MKDSEYGEDTIKMIYDIVFLEFSIECKKSRIQMTEELLEKKFQTVNIGGEILDRGFSKLFFGGGPKGINKRVRQGLIRLMLTIDKEHPDLKRKNFDKDLKYHQEVNLLED